MLKTTTNQCNLNKVINTNMFKNLFFKFVKNS